jgi:hypothetical protein
MQSNSSKLIGLCLLVAACGGPDAQSGVPLPTGTQPSSPQPAPQSERIFYYEGPAAVSTGTSSSAGKVFVAAYKNPSSSHVSVAGPNYGGDFSFAHRGVPTVGTFTLKDAVYPTGATWEDVVPRTADNYFGEYYWDANRSPGTVVLTLTEVSPEAIHGTIHFAEKYTVDATF